MTYPICGKCLHARSSHSDIPDSKYFVYCGKCMNVCDKDEYLIDHKPSMITINDGIAYNMSLMNKKRNDST